MSGGGNGCPRSRSTDDADLDHEGICFVDSGEGMRGTDGGVMGENWDLRLCAGARV